MVSLHSLQECALFPQALFTAGNKELQTVTAMHYSVDNKLTQLTLSALLLQALFTTENKELQTVVHYILDNNQMHKKIVDINAITSPSTQTTKQCSKYTAPVGIQNITCDKRTVIESAREQRTVLYLK